MVAFPPVKDLAGELLQFGVERVHREWNAIDGPMPSWLGLNSNATAGTTVVSDPITDGRPRASVAFTASTNCDFGTFTGMPVTAALKAVGIGVKAFRGYPGSLNFRITPTPNPAIPNKQGVTAIVPGTDPDPATNSNTVTFAKNISPNPGSTYAAARYSWIGTLDMYFLWVRENQCAYLFEGDSVVAAVDLSVDFLDPTTLSPVFVINSVPGRAHSFAGLEFDLWYD